MKGSAQPLALGFLALLGLGAIAVQTPLQPPVIDARPPAPLVVMIDKPTVVYTPGGQRYDLPAGTEIDACLGGGNALMSYDMQAMIVHVPEPCSIERPLFADGFE